MPKQHYPAEFKQEAASLVLDQDYTRAAACEAMGANKLTRRACPWHPAAALHRLAID